MVVRFWHVFLFLLAAQVIISCYMITKLGNQAEQKLNAAQSSVSGKLAQNRHVGEKTTIIANNEAQVEKPKENNDPLLNTIPRQSDNQKEELKLEEYDEPQPGARELGFKAKETGYTKVEGDIEVFIIPHSHCDAGWLKTFDRYYEDEVASILTTVTSALKNNPHRKFGWVEIGFLEKWWKKQSNEVKTDFRLLYESGQIEFLMGGWVSNDEATVTYMQCINQMTEGHRFLLQEFGSAAIPRIGWQIDPFGLSQVTATMFSQMCFDANAAWRVGGTNRRDYLAHKNIEFLWRGSPTLGASSDVLLHLLPWSYATEDKFLFDKASSYKVNTASGLKTAAEALVNSFKERSAAYPSNILMWPWGHDFQFTKAHRMFDSMDKIIEFINDDPSFHVHVTYGTPAEYFDAIHDKEITYPLMQRDFLPYGPTTINWWNGYYTSRPRLKGYCRDLDALQRSAEFVFTWAKTLHFARLATPMWDGLFDKLEYVRHIQGIMQHHDAITGTMREHVLLDYYEMIDQANTHANTILSTLIPLLIDDKEILAQHFIVLMKGETVPMVKMGSDPKFILLFNSLPWSRTEMYSISVDTPMVDIVELSKSKFVVSSVLPPSTRYQHGKQLLTGYRVFFEVTVPQVGFKLFSMYENIDRTFEDVTAFGDRSIFDMAAIEPMDGFQLLQTIPHDIFIENEDIRVDLDDSGSMKRFTQKSASSHRHNGTREDPASLDFEKKYWEYKSDSKWDNHYTFKALDDGKEVQHEESSFYVIKTPLVQEVYQKINSMMVQRVSIFKNQNYVQVTDLIGPPRTGMNYVARYSSSLDSNDHFYTDDSGLEMLERRYNESDIYSGNFYPMIYSSFIRKDDASFTAHTVDPLRQISIVTDRTHGITSVRKGSFDLMLHRNTLQPHGNGEKMADVNPVQLTSWILFTNDDNMARQQLSMRLNFPLSAVFTSTLNPNDVFLESSFLAYEFPRDVFLMNLDMNERSGDAVALRVNNLRQKEIFELYEPPVSLDGEISYSGLDKEISLRELFPYIQQVEERTLSLNQKVEHCKRHHWHHSEESNQHPLRYGENIFESAGKVKDEGIVKLPPLGIRSFLTTFDTK